MAGESIFPAGALIETTDEAAQSMISAGYAQLVPEIETTESKAVYETAQRTPNVKKKRYKCVGR